MSPHPLWTELRGDLASCGYFPELVEDTVNLGVGGMSR